MHLHQHQSSHTETIWWTIERVLGDDVICCCYSAPQSQAGLLDRPHLLISALKRPTPVHSLLSLTQACCGRSDPEQILNSTWMVRQYIHTAWWWTVATLLTKSTLSSGPLSHLVRRLTEGLLCLWQRDAEILV